MEIFGEFSIFLLAFVNELRLTEKKERKKERKKKKKKKKKKNKMEIFVAGLLN